MFSPLRRRQGTGFTFKAAQGLLGRPAGWRRWNLLTAAGLGEAGREPELEREAGPSGRRRSTRADRAGRGGALGRPRGGVVLGAACERARPARGEGARSWVAGGGSSAFSGEGSAGCRAGLWGASWGEGGTKNPRSQLLRGRVSPGSSCPRGGALWLGQPVGKGAARGGLGPELPEERCLRTGVNPPRSP